MHTKLSWQTFLSYHTVLEELVGSAALNVTKAFNTCYKSLLVEFVHGLLTKLHLRFSEPANSEMYFSKTLSQSESAETKRDSAVWLSVTHTHVWREGKPPAKKLSPSWKILNCFSKLSRLKQQC